MFFTPTPERAARKQLAEARMAELEHQAAAEHHAALARMYRERVARLERIVTDVPRELQARGAAA